MSTTLADDLLKSRTIGDLRSLIQGLRNDAQSKRSELQSMVGSQYHEFIQSADKIAKMDEQSKTLTASLDKFWSQNQQVIQNVNRLLGQKPQPEKQLLNIAVTNSNSIQKFVHELNATGIWKDLSVCDIYAATVKGLCSFFLIDKANSNGTFGEFLLGENARSSIVNFVVSEQNKRDLQSASFLTDTIIDDAKVFCLEDDSEYEEGLVEQKAKALASLSVLQTWKKSKVPGIAIKSVVDTYLDCAKLKIDHLFATNLNQNKKIGEDMQVNGLVAFYQIQLATEVNYIFSNSSSTWDLAKLNTAEIKQQMKISRSWIQDQLKRVTDGCSSLLHSLNSATQVAQLQQKVYSKCCSVASTNIKICSDFLNIPPFMEIWNDCCSELLIHKSVKHRRVISSSSSAHHDPLDTALILWSTVFRSSFLHQVERLLHKACEDILHNVCDSLVYEFSSLGLSVYVDSKKGDIEIQGIGNFNINTATITSARIFTFADRIRSTFDSALGKLLEDVITPVQRSELNLSKSIESKNSHSALSSQALMRALQGNCCKLIGQILSLLRRICEACKSFLQGTGNLTWKDRSMKGNNKAGSIIRKEFAKILKDQFSSGVRLTGNLSSYADVSHFGDRVKLGLLLIGRIAWLMKIRSNAISAALSDTQSNSSNLGTSMVYPNGLDTETSPTDTISEDQFRSAFEIADTDGDGIVNRSEIFEALQALSIGDQYPKVFQMNHDGPVGHNGELSLASSLSYDEFMLVFGSPVFTWQNFQPLRRLNSALDHIVSFSHVIWAFSSVNHLAHPFLPTVSEELGIDEERPKSNLKSSFQAKWIDLDTSNDNDDDAMDTAGTATREQILVPSRISKGSFTFIHGISTLASTFLVSMDTIQLSYASLSPNIATSEEEDHDGSSADGKADWLKILIRNQTSKFSLCQVVVELLYELALEQLYHGYDQMVSIYMENKTKYKQEYIDDVIMQFLIDLMVLEKLLTKSSILSGGKSSAGYLELMDKCKLMMDPITAELSDVPLNQVANQIYESTRLFMFVANSRLNKGASESNEPLTPQPSTVKESTDQLMARLFPASSSMPRCALLPIALSLNVPSNSKGTNNKTIEKNDHNGPKVNTAVEETKTSNKSNIIKWW